MIYGSVCSGIEAATAAWHPLGWKPAFFSEIDKAACAVLRHHYHDVPLHGDFTTINGDDYGAIDLLVGGTPCQDFSVAGLRKGITGERGNLTLEFIRLVERKQPRWVVWENVPGVLSIDRGRAFGALLGGLAQCGYGFAYRVLDAQFFGVPQRRRRVFVIGYIGDWRPAAAVLFEREGLRWDPPPSREKGKRIAPTISARTKGGGGLGTDFDLDGGLIAADISPTLDGRSGRSGANSFATSGGLISHSLRDEGFDASEDGTGRGIPLIPQISPALKARDYKGPSSDGDGDGSPLIPCYTINTQIATRHNKLGERTGMGISDDGQAPTIGANHHHAVAFVQNTRDEVRLMGGNGDITGALSAESGAKQQCYVAFQQNASGEVRTGEAEYTLNTNSNASGRNTGMVQSLMQVRRLMPIECERLQGFKDNYTLVPFGKRMMADGPRYKMLGNSMAVPCMSWLGQRIQMVEDIINDV